jgi:hypothetical protein
MTTKSDSYAIRQLKKHEIFVSPKSYKIDGKEYYRVTSILGIIAKHGLRNWMGKVGHKKAAKILENRQVLGTHVHKLVELNLKGKDINLSSYEQEIQDGLLEFNKFKKAAKLKPKLLEQPLWSNKYRYAGTPDYIGNYITPIEYLAAEIIEHKRVKKPKFKKDSFVIGDWKTGKDVYQEYWLQITAYIVALEELTGLKAEGAFIARIHGGKIQVKEKTTEELKAQFGAFISALDVYEWKYKLGKYAFLRKRK